ncbi:MAG: hypothetical protein ACTHN8_16735 [Angustibacter sp.]
MPSTMNDEMRPHLVRDALSRYWALVLVATLLGAGLAALAAESLTREYTASAKVLLRPTVGNPLSPDNASSGPQVTIAMQTESTLVDSDSVAELSRSKGAPAWSPGTGAVTATVPPNTQVLQVTFRATSAAAAQQGANGVAQGFLAYRESQTTTTIANRTKVLNEQIDAATKKLTAALKAQSSTSTTTSTNASRQVQLLTDQLISLQDANSKLKATDTAPGLVLSPAKAPVAAAGLASWSFVVGGAFLGLLLGLALALGITRADTRLRRTTTAAAGVPVLAVLGPRRRRAGRGARWSYQQLRTGILASAPPSSCVAVCGMSQGARVDDVVLLLGSSFARAGYRVVVVTTRAGDALQQPGDEDLPGLSDVLRGGRTAGELLVQRGDLRVLPAGRDVDDVQESLAGDRFAAVLRELGADADYVLVAGPLATSPLGIAVGRAATGMLLVGRELRTRAGSVEDVCDRAHLGGAHVLGVALRARNEEVEATGQPPSGSEQQAATPAGSGAAAPTSSPSTGQPAAETAPTPRAAAATGAAKSLRR